MIGCLNGRLWSLMGVRGGFANISRETKSFVVGLGALFMRERLYITEPP